MTRTDNPSAVPALLAELGMGDDTALWAMTRTDPGADGRTRAVAQLALTAAISLGNLADAERHAGQRLARLAELHGYEVDKLTNGLRGDATWVVQAAGNYADALARIQVLIEAFRAAAMPLAALADLRPRERETVWCEAHGGTEYPHFERDDCQHPTFTDQQTRARLNAAG